MRIRQVKPSWWLDKALRKGLTADQREFYIGLWQLADDAGWFEWDVERIGAELYPYDGVSRRERNVAHWAEILEQVQPESRHLIRYSCGHAWVPKMAAHQRITGKQTLTIRDRHMACRGAVSLSEPTTDEGSPGRVGNGRERNVTVAPDGATDFQSRVPREVALGGKQ